MCTENCWRSAVILIRGVPGSGKTTLAHSLISLFDEDPSFEGWESIMELSADRFMIDERGDYRFNPEKLKFCHRTCFNKFGAALFASPDDGSAPCDTILIHNTFTQKWEIDPYIACCTGSGKNLIVVRCEGKFDNIHGVPADKVEAMRNRMEPIDGEIVLSWADLESGYGAKKVYKHLIDMCTKKEINNV